MELYPVRWVFSFPEILWSLRQLARRSNASGWPSVSATVEGYELLLAKGNGWFVVFYSYEFAGERYTGEFRKWLLFTFSSKGSATSRVMEQFPRGATIIVHVDPQNPSHSIAER